ncbi:MAG: alkyl sulfatase dimerization domain-containing protein, partial [Acidimicrobiia bacterium]|nr:alkyl sulfatase dimerization domain-containing protein [Acidimicrobiia bacterium]
DISNITFIEGETGWVIIDPLTVEPTARACLDLANRTLGERPVVAVIYTHSHTDHFGGVHGVTTQEDVDAGRCQIIAPEHFMRETIGENVIAGLAMMRRAAYQFGPLLPAGPRQHVDCGLGKAIPLYLAGLIAPTVDITHTGQELVVDGVRIVFQMTPEAEAPAEMNFFFPDKGWLCMAENCTHNMHNLVPIRGALVRDARKWSRYINEAREMYGGRTDVMFASHHWPRWGRDDVDHFLTLQRDLYAWIHDQTMRWANHGLVATEIADTLEFPHEFRTESHTIGYYGHLVHNSKAVYQRYLSWYDGNPAHLWQRPPTEAGERYVELAGGSDALLAHARSKFAEGDYRWVAEIVNHLVFADPTNGAARELQADALEQLGYQSESSTFRNAYLTGAQELRNGTMPPQPATQAGYLDAMPPDQLFDTMAVRVRSEDVDGIDVTINMTFRGHDEPWVLGLANRVINYARGRHDPAADATVSVERHTMVELATQRTTIDDALAAGTLSIDGDAAAFAKIIDNLEVFMNNFKIVEP